MKSRLIQKNYKPFVFQYINIQLANFANRRARALKTSFLRSIVTFYWREIEPKFQRIWNRQEKLCSSGKKNFDFILYTRARSNKTLFWAYILTFSRKQLGQNCFFYKNLDILRIISSGFPLSCILQKCTLFFLSFFFPSLLLVCSFER